MKKFISLLTVLTLTAFAVFGTTWTVSKNPDIPGQFTEIKEAIESGTLSAGDTLLVAGASAAYSNFTVIEPLVIIGAGMNNPYGLNTSVANIYLETQGSFTPSGTVVSGFRITNSFNLDGQDGSIHTIEDVVVERCWIQYSFDFEDNSIFNNIDVRNCVFKWYNVYFANNTYTDVVFYNCLFDDMVFVQNTSASLAGVKILNCTFINETSNIFGGIKDMVIENNIFMKALPQGCTGCTFNSNTSYGSTNDVITGGNGENTVENPKFVNYTITDGAFDFNTDYDFKLQPTSPCIGTGVGSTDRGMFGGPMPIDIGTNPSIPQLTEISFTDNASSVKEEGTLNVKFKAKKQD